MIVSWMLFALVTGGFLTAAAVAADRLASLSRRPRRFVWLTTLILTAWWPVFSLLVSWLPRFESSQSTSAPIAAARRLTMLVVAPPAWDLSWRWTWTLVVIWLIGSAFLLVRFGLALSYAPRRGASWRQMDLDGMRVHIAGDVGPAVVGLHDMAIVLPEWTLDADPAMRALILRHEAEHREARDPYLLLIAALLTALIPWNIPLWFQARRLRLAIEVDCDQRVLATHPSWREYARLLLMIAQRRSLTSHRLAPALLETPSNLERRITAMRTAPGLSRLNALFLIVAASGAFAIACAVDRPESPLAPPSSQATLSPPTSDLLPKRLDPSQPFFEFQVEKSATPSGPQNVKYPAAFKTADASGSVIAQYVVARTGRVDMKTFKVLTETDPRLSAAVKTALPTWQYEPATVGGRKVSQLVQQAFEFPRP